jgi:hypothetical protein
MTANRYMRLAEGWEQLQENPNVTRELHLSVRQALELLKPENVKTSTMVDKTAKPDRRRVNATYCPTCGGWVEVRLNPVRLRCTRCGVEARP